MSRPTRFCVCGEYIKLVGGYRMSADGIKNVTRLIHIDANGFEIFRAHAPLEDQRGHKVPLVKPPQPPARKPPTVSKHVAGKTRKTKSGK